MNVYERIINILLEARVDMFIQDRLDEAKLKGKQKKLDVNKSGSLDAEDFKMLRSGKRTDEGVIKAANKAKLKSWKQTLPKSKKAGTLAPDTEPAVGAAAITRAGAARRGVPAGEEGPAKRPNAGEAKYQLARAGKMDKPKLPK